MLSVCQILSRRIFTKETLVTLLSADGNDRDLIFSYASEIKNENIGNKVHLRGLIELTNICEKNCHYCGIAATNKVVSRFMVGNKEVEDAIRFSIENNYGSIVIQSGELQSRSFTSRIEDILYLINKLGKGNIGITLSCGEQSEETYQRWFDAGASRYLLRMEASNEDLFYKLHPNNEKHSFKKRMEAISNLKKCGYQTGTGVMIGLPFQTIENLAEDLLKMQELDIDMCGMGPYIEHVDTYLYKFKTLVPSVEKRIDLSLKMVAILRIMMKDINIAATTAMQTLVDGGREMALKVGANILMPNTTPGLYREKYALYNNKPGINEEAEDSKYSIERIIKSADCVPAYNELGTSKHYKLRTSLCYA